MEHRGYLGRLICVQWCSTAYCSGKRATAVDPPVPSPRALAQAAEAPAAAEAPVAQAAEPAALEDAAPWARFNASGSAQKVPPIIRTSPRGMHRSQEAANLVKHTTAWTAALRGSCFSRQAEAEDAAPWARFNAAPESAQKVPPRQRTPPRGTH